MITLEDELKEIGFNGQQLRKNYAFYHLVRSRMGERFSTVIDLCSGNGLSGFIFCYYGFAEKSIMVDIKKPKKFSRLEPLFNKYELLFEHTLQDINDSALDFSDSGRACLISIHPCGKLCDRVMNIGLKSNIPFAIMTCCHENDSPDYDLKNPPDPRKELYPEPADYFDLVRARYIQETGWKSEICEIQRGITEKNHVIIAHPKDFQRYH